MPLLGSLAAILAVCFLGHASLVSISKVLPQRSRSSGAPVSAACLWLCTCLLFYRLAGILGVVG